MTATTLILVSIYCAVVAFGIWAVVSVVVHEGNDIEATKPDWDGVDEP